MYLSINPKAPGPGRPIALSMPFDVSYVLGVAFPMCSSGLIPFTVIAPNLLISTRSAYSGPYPKVPEATVTGFIIFIDPIDISKFGLFIPKNLS